MNNIKTKEEAEIYIYGMITGLNKARLLIWGMGYDNDETALMMRKKIMNEIFELKEILEIKHIGSVFFDSASGLLEGLSK